MKSSKKRQNTKQNTKQKENTKTNNKTQDQREHRRDRVWRGLSRTGPGTRWPISSPIGMDGGWSGVVPSDRASCSLSISENHCGAGAASVQAPSHELYSGGIVEEASCSRALEAQRQEAQEEEEKKKAVTSWSWIALMPRRMAVWDLPAAKPSLSVGLGWSSCATRSPALSCRAHKPR